MNSRWRRGGVVYRDDLVRLIVDVPDADGNRRWVREFKERWRCWLEQIELWMVSCRIDVE